VDEKMDKSRDKERNNADKVARYKSFFSGLSTVYGTYDPTTGRSWQVKRKVTNDTILAHLKGKRPYGVYLLDQDRIRAIAADFDDSDSFPPVEFVNAARHYYLPAYIEISKSKGFHVWIFFNNNGVKAFKARLVVKNILEEIEYPQTEIFPKQDFLDTRASYGNFINAPLFGGLVPREKTVFIEPYTLKPYPDQWAFLESIKRVEERVLDEIIELNGLSITHKQPHQSSYNSDKGYLNRFSLPPCAQKMFRDGVTHFQRVSCFRLAVHLKRLGLPYDVAIAGLKIWAQKNRPSDGKQVLTEREIIEQTSYAFNKAYRGYGCNSEAVAPFCHPDCPVYRQGAQKKPHAGKRKRNIGDETTGS
jgi:hypothetical protein